MTPEQLDTLKEEAQVILEYIEGARAGHPAAIANLRIAVRRIAEAVLPHDLKYASPTV